MKTSNQGAKAMNRFRHILIEQVHEGSRRLDARMTHAGFNFRAASREPPGTQGTRTGLQAVCRLPQRLGIILVPVLEHRGRQWRSALQEARYRASQPRCAAV